MSIDREGRAQRFTVAISGATGMIGSALVERLRGSGHTVRRLVRNQENRQDGDVLWDPHAGLLDAAELEGCDAIVNLAGEPIAQRWTDSTKRKIRDSRVRATSLIARAVTAMRAKPRVVLSGSAVGYYGDGGDKELAESSASGNGFLASVTRDWEAAAMPIAECGVRLALLRTGIVLSLRGGALRELLTPFKFGVGGPIGGGEQWMSWISLEDHVRAMIHVINTEGVSGAVNLVSPVPVRNAEFAHTLGAALHRPSLLPLPGIALELMFGEMAVETILWGQKASCQVLESSAFSFSQPSLDGALRLLLA